LAAFFIALTKRVRKEEPRNNIAAFGRNSMTVQDENLAKARKKVNDIIIQDNFTSEDEDGLFDILQALEDYSDGGKIPISFSDSELALLQKYEVDVSFFDDGDGKDAIKEIVIPMPYQEKTELDAKEDSLTEENKDIVLNRREEIELELTRGIKDKDFEPLIAELHEMEDDGESLLLKIKSAESKRFDDLEQKIDVFLQNKAYDKAKASLGKLKALRGSSPKIEEFEKSIAKQGEQATETREIREAKSLLKRDTEYIALLKGLDLARKILERKKDNDASVADLRVLLADAEKKRQEISAKIDAAQTMGAMKQYAEQDKAYADLIQKGIFYVEDPDDKSKKVRIALLQCRARKNLRDATKNTVQKRLAKAKDSFSVTPRVAMIFLNEIAPFMDIYIGGTQKDDCTELEKVYWKTVLNLGTEEIKKRTESQYSIFAKLSEDEDNLYLEYTELREKAEEKYLSWKKAGSYINSATGLFPKERLKRYKQAQEAFKAYEGINEKIANAEDEFRTEVARNSYVKLKQQKVLLNIKAVKVPFDEIKKVLKAVREAINGLGEPVGVLVDVQKELVSIQKLEQEYERRHLAIQEVGKLLRNELDKDNPAPAFLQETLKSLAKEDREHELLREERIRIGHLSNDSEKYNLANTAFKNGNFSEAVKQVEGINAQGDLGKARDTLIKRAGYHLFFKKAKEAKANSDYITAQKLAYELVSQLSIEKLPENLLFFYEKVKSFAADVKNLQEKTAAFEETFNKAKQAHALDFDQRLDSLQSLLGEYADRKALIDEISKLEKELKKGLEGKIIAFQKKISGQKGEQLSATDYEEAHQAFDASRTLEKRNLLQNVNTLALAKWIRDIYPKLETEYFRSRGDWKELLAKIQEKYGNNVKTYPIHIKAQFYEAKRYQSLEEARRALKEIPPNAEKSQETLAKVLEENNQLVNDAEVAMLRSVIALYQGDTLGAANILQIAEQDQNQREFTQQIRELLVQLRIIQQRQEEAKRYLSGKDYGMLDRVLSNLDLIFKQLNSMISQSDAVQFLFYTREEYHKNRSAWSNTALSSLQKSLMDVDKSIAEKVMLIFQIKKIDSDSPVIIQKLDELSPDILQEMKRLLRQVKEFYNSRKYASLPIEEGNSLFVKHENTLHAFKKLEMLPNEMDEYESEQFEELVKAISQANKEKIFSLIKEVRQELGNHVSYLKELTNQLAPYLEYRTLVSNKVSLVNAGDENVCILYEQGRDTEGVVEKIRDSDIVGNFSENPDVNSFEDWTDEVNQNRRKAFELIDKMEKGFNNSFGQEELERNDDISLRIKKDIKNYDVIIKAIKKIKQLTPKRQRDTSDETLGYEDIYNLDTEVEWDDDYSGKKVKSINAHYKLATMRKASLLAYNEWYNRLAALSVPKTHNANVLLAGDFDVGLTNMVFDKHQYGVRQEVDYLEDALKNYKKEYTKAKTKPKYDLLDDLAEELEKKGEEEAWLLDKQEKEIRERLEKLKTELPKLKGLQQDTARKLRPKKPAFSSIKKNLIEQHRLNPQDEAFSALLSTYKEKYQKSQKKGFSFFGK
jgi:hypothetical protein